jgi:hypothetical protein
MNSTNVASSDLPSLVVPLAVSDLMTAQPAALNAVSWRREPNERLDVALTRHNVTNTTKKNAKGEAMRWLQGEPKLDDVLSAPTIRALMERDGVDPTDLRMFLEDVSGALERSRVSRQPRQ